jgi:hypothetical protein
MSTKTLWTPGTAPPQRGEVLLPMEYLKMLVLLAAASEHDYHLVLTCSDCKQQVDGENARQDNFWRMHCSCRSFVGVNQLPKDR